MPLAWPHFVRPRKAATLSPPNPEELERDSVGTFALGAGSRSPNSRLRVAAEWALLWLLIVAFAVTAFIPACRHLNSDFPNYYLVARLYRAGFKLDRVYDWTWLQRQKDYAGIDQGLITFIPLTLPSALIMRPLASLPPLQAKRCWLAANLVFLLLIAGLLTRISDLNWRQVGLLMFLAFVPLRSNFMLGQMHVLILLLLTFALWLYLRRFHFTAGIMLAVAAALKLYPALFLVFFIFKRQWRAAIGLTAGLLGSALLSLYVFGKTACEVYVREILPSALRGETIDPYHVAFGSITALLRRLFIAEPELNPAPVAHLPWLYALLQPAVHTLIFMLFLCAIGPREGDQQKVKRDWALYIFLLLFIASQPAGYHFVVLILPATLILDEIARKRGRVLARVGVAMYVLTCLSTFPLFSSPSGWQSLLFFPRFWLMAILSSGLLFWSFSAGSEGGKHKLSVGTKSLVGGIAIILTIAGFYSTERHLREEFDNYRNRVATSPGSLFAANPAVNSEGILFTVMTKGGYTIRHAEAESVRDLPRTHGDWFHPALAQHSDFFWAEQATDYGSRIVQMENTVPTPTGTSVEIEDAMEPVVSRNGEWLAFFRAVKGRNSLWVQRIGSLGEGSRLLSSRQLAGPEYDARGVDFISDDQLIFSSGDGRLLLADLANNLVLREWVVGCFARDPAVSPDGRWIAFSCRQKGNWQLHTMGFHDHAELQLTIGECNSITPAWTTDSKSLIYATDCGRGVGLTALAKINVNP
jgi:Glycosyltransferase family 87/WD40-like Beta Propeller Repeat